MNLHNSLGELCLTFPCKTKSQSGSVSFGFMFHYRHFCAAQILKTQAWDRCRAPINTGSSHDCSCASHLFCEGELPFQQMERGDAHTMRTCLCPSQLPSHHGLRQRWRRSGHLELNNCSENGRKKHGRLLQQGTALSGLQILGLRSGREVRSNITSTFWFAYDLPQCQTPHVLHQKSAWSVLFN